MTEEQLSELSDDELLEEAKKMKSSAVSYALMIGFLIGIIVFSIWKNVVGLFTLIPLYFAYKLFSNSENQKANQTLQNILKERNLN